KPSNSSYLSGHCYSSPTGFGLVNPSVSVRRKFTRSASSRGVSPRLPTWPFDATAAVASSGDTPATFCTLSITSGGGKEPCISGRGAEAKVEGHLVPEMIDGYVPLVIKMYDLFETLEDRIVHVGLHEARRRSLVHVADARGLEQ